MDLIAQAVNSHTEDLAHNRIYVSVKEAIITLQFLPGQRLPIGKIADQLKVSRTPVREALNRLVQEGLVEREGGWGYVIKQITLKDIMDLYSVREALEVQAAKTVIPHLNAESIARLVAINKQAEDAFEEKRYPDFLAHNRNFHRLLAHIADNKLLEGMLGIIHDRVRQLGSLVVHLYETRADELLMENRQILEAIRARDETALVTAIRRHIERGREHIFRLTENPIGQFTFPMSDTPFSG